MSVLIFRIKTIPDLQSAKHLYNLSNLSDGATAQALFKLQKDNTGNNELPHHLHQVVNISVLHWYRNKLSIDSFDNHNKDEKTLLSAFFKLIESNIHQLISWDGDAFEWPVLNHRCLLHNIVAPKYWSLQQGSQAKAKTIRLINLSCAFQASNRLIGPSLADIATFLGILKPSETKVSDNWQHYSYNKLEAIKQGCEIEVIIAFIIYLRLCHIQGKLPLEEFNHSCQNLRTLLKQDKQSHFNQFETNWGFNL